MKITALLGLKALSKHKEIWKDIQGYEGHYQVSNLGNVRSLDRTVAVNLSKQPERKVKGRVLRKTINKYGYCCVLLWLNKKSKFSTIHRLVANAFIPNPLDKPQVNHKDSNRSNNYVHNLEWATHSENQKHGYLAGNVNPPIYKGKKEFGLNYNKNYEI